MSRSERRVRKRKRQGIDAPYRSREIWALAGLGQWLIVFLLLDAVLGLTPLWVSIVSVVITIPSILVLSPRLLLIARNIASNSYRADY